METVPIEGQSGLFVEVNNKFPASAAWRSVCYNLMGSIKSDSLHTEEGEVDG